MTSVKDDTHEAKKLFGKRLKSKLDEYGLRQNAFAAEIGVTESTVGEWVLGKSMPRTMGMIEKIAARFHVGKNYFLDADPPADDAPRGYYHDPETARIAEEMRTDPQIRAMADATRGMTPEQMKEIMEYIRFQKAKERGDYDF